MKNRQKLITRIEQANSLFKEELSYYSDMDSNLDQADAFGDLLDDAEYYQSEDPKTKRVWDECKKILIDVGFVEPVDTSKVVCTGKKYWFRMNGICYQCVSGWSQWIEK